MPKPPEACPAGKEPKDQCHLSPRSHWHLRTSPREEELGGPVLAWLSAWEARQERLLRRHEEAMRQQVEALRRELNSRPRAVSSESSGSQLPAVAERPRKWSTPSEEVTQRVLSKLSAPVRMGMSAVPRRAPERPRGLLRGRAFDVVHGRGFAAGTGAVIFLYTAAVGVMADVEMRLAAEGAEEPQWLWWVDGAFAALFFAELLLRVLSDGRAYFDGAERNWNVFDALVALSGFADIGLGVYMKTGFLRILRACRVIRVLRVMRVFRRVNALGYLQLMTEALLSCLPCLGWGLVLLGSLQYIFAVILLRGAKEELRSGTLSTSTEKVLKENFIGVHSAMLSLTMAISGGRNWGEFAGPFAEVSPFFGLCFPFFVVFLIFGALNILTGIFVESTSSIAKQNKELAVQEEMARAENVEIQIREFFQDLDADESGTLSREELARSLKDPRVKAYFKAVLQIDVADSQTLFHLLDQNNDGKVSTEEFIEKCLRLRGAARAMDVAMVRREHWVMKKQFKALMGVFEDMRQTSHQRSRAETL